MSGGGAQLMSVHYSDQRALSSAQAKRQVLQLFFDLVRQHEGARAALDGTGATLPLGTFTWEELARLHHQTTTRPSLHEPSSSTTYLPLSDQLPSRASMPLAEEQLALQDQARVQDGRRAKKDKDTTEDKKARTREASSNSPQGKRHHAHHGGGQKFQRA